MSLQSPTSRSHWLPGFHRSSGSEARLPRRVSSWLFSLLILIGLFVGSGGTPLAHAVDTFSPLAQTKGSSNLKPNGSGSGDANIQTAPQVYLVFWGSKWNSDSSGTISQVQATFNALPGSQYNNILSEYYGTHSDPNSYVHNDVQFMGSWIDAQDDSLFQQNGGQIAIDREVMEEEAIAAGHFGLNTSDTAQMHNVQILVFPQDGTGYDTLLGFANYCGMHYYDGSTHIAFGLVVYSTLSSCGTTQVTDQNGNLVFGSIAESIAWTAVHEYAEIATDQYIYTTVPGTIIGGVSGGGWQTSDGGAAPTEVADLCEGYQPDTINGVPYIYNTNTKAYMTDSSGANIPWPYYSAGNVSSPKENNASQFILPLLWSNNANGCVMSQGQEFSSPDYTAPFHGTHTVQGAILTHYYAFGADTGGLGQPVSEETPIAGGRVSYFANNGCGPVSAIYWSPATGANTVYGCIMAHYQDLGEANSFLGFPVTDETDAPGGGRVNYFEGTSWGSHCTAYGGPAPYTNSYGAIYWNGNDALAVKGCVYNYYQDVAGGPAGSMGLGLPLTEETPLNGGIIETFAGSSCGSSTGSAIYDSNGTGVHAMKGCIYYYYNTYYNGTYGMGFPTSDELSMGGGHAQQFANGMGLYDGPGTGIHQVIGAIWGQYVNLGEANSFLGFPVTDETGVSSGRVSYFGGTTWGSNCGNPGPYNSHAAIYWSGATGAWEVHGCLYDAYVNRFGGPDGRLGFPVENQENPAGGGHLQYFQNGYILDDVNGNITMRIICPPAC